MKNIALIALIFFITGCANTTDSPQPDNQASHPGYQVNSQHPSQSQSERVRFLILHYTAANDAESLRLLSQGTVSAHYLVPGTGSPLLNQSTVYQLVAEDKRAWHAGVSEWRGRTHLNDSSIGIEIVNLGYKKSSKSLEWYPWDGRQINLVARLARDIIKRYDITPDRVLGHSDVAPTRKVDPGPLFPWQQLAEMGIGAWPDSSTIRHYLAGRAPDDRGSVRNIQIDLARYGYAIPQTGILDALTQQTITAFQMHFRPSDYSGKADAETEAIAAALVAKYHPDSQILRHPPESDMDI
ncbi:N-acetylmuramoyl-L-alanine amidase [Erwinia sorbitola]|uniref:N-acetylmuramoyl-L-alanine amidase n=1 Tax=Erwinia sorbitola TaxID=2681984 RepID=A0ABW9R7E9_9GAMM|nr:N-acetylmuramoyl-L-alanine amidase [Erwinia sorbitola]MTD26004.1 N-acetylmuramoyl-L-alanine amidase [Erwinia sorbitola]